MNDDISRMLHDAAPEGPDPTAWADGARRRSNRRRALGGVIAAVAAVALITPVTFSLQGPETTTVQATSSHSTPVSAAPGQLAPAECAQQAGDQDEGWTTDMSLPSGAVRIWLCAESLMGWEPPLPGLWVGAPEPLTIGVDDAIETFNALPVAQTKRCPAPHRYTATMVFEYTDGSRRVVGANDGGCDQVGNRGGWRSYLSALTDLWSRQREVLDTQFTREVQVCPATQSLLQPRPGEASRGYLCPDDAQTGLPFWGQRPLPSDVVSDIAGEIDSAQTRLEEGFPPDLAVPNLVLVNTYGDPVSMTRTHAEEGNPPQWRWGDAEGVHLWTPSAELSQRIDSLLQTPSGIPTSVPAAPDSLTPPACTASDGGLPDATLFPGHELPGGAVRVWLCGKELDDLTRIDTSGGEHDPLAVVGAPEPLTGLAAEAVAAFNRLPLWDGTHKKCPPALRYSAAVVVEYPGGHQEVLRAWDGGCSEVGGRTGWRDYFSTLKDLWGEQRTLHDVNLVAEVQVCPGTDSLMDPTPADAVRGYVCATTTSSADPGGQRPLPPALVTDITTEIRGDAPPPADTFPKPGAPTIVLLTGPGDPVTLARGSVDASTGTTWFWSDQHGTYAWTPSPDLAERLDAELLPE